MGLFLPCHNLINIWSTFAKILCTFAAPHVVVQVRLWGWLGVGLCSDSFVPGMVPPCPWSRICVPTSQHTHTALQSFLLQVLTSSCCTSPGPDEVHALQLHLAQRVLSAKHTRRRWGKMQETGRECSQRCLRWMFFSSAGLHSS